MRCAPIPPAALAVAAVAGAALLLAPGAAAEPVDYVVDPTHTFVQFEVPHFGTSITRGRWNRKSGRVTLDRAAASGRVELTLEMASIDTGVGAFDDWLRSAPVFDVAAHPQARFVGERFVFDGQRLRAVGGILTLRGRSAPLTLSAQRFDCYLSPLFKREVCGGDFEATLSRSAWGVGPAGNASGAAGAAPVPDAIRLVVQVEAIRQ